MLPTMNRRGTRASRRVTVLAAALFGAVVGAGSIAGCANEEEQAPQSQDKPDKQEPAPEPEPTKDETPDGPDLPDKLDEQYVHVVLNYFEAWQTSMGDGNVDSFMQYAKEGCQTCEGMADVITDAVGNGGSVESAGMEPVLDSERNLVAEHSDSSATVIVHYQEGEFTLVSKKGAKPQVAPERRVDMQADVVREDDTWLIKEIYPEEVKAQ